MLKVIGDIVILKGFKICLKVNKGTDRKQYWFCACVLASDTKSRFLKHALYRYK